MRFPLRVSVVALLVASGCVAVVEAPVASAAACPAMTVPVHQAVARDSGDSVLTTSSSADVTPLTTSGAVTDEGVAFLASLPGRAGTTVVRHLRAADGRNAYALDDDDIAAWQAAGYVLQSDRFAVSTTAAACTQPVFEVRRPSDGAQRLVPTPGTRDELVAAGWKSYGTAFYAAVDTTFSIAVIPDTQQEVIPDGGPAGRFADRAQWLSDNASALDLRYITHTGDVVNWDTDDHAQYENTIAGRDILDASGVPWSFSIGNHDTEATGPGGSARPGGNPTVDQRNTTTFNSYYGVGHAADLAGTFQAGKIDNSYSTFAAGGKDWLVLNLELWPRTAVVSWAAQVVADHPSYNVMVVTHAFLNADSTIQQDNGGYGANSPQYVWDRLAGKYANVRFVFSGHTGTFGYLRGTGTHGNPVDMVMSTYHSGSTDPVRIVSIDTANGTYSTQVDAPYTGDFPLTDGSAYSATGMAWV